MAYFLGTGCKAVIHKKGGVMSISKAQFEGLQVGQWITATSGSQVQCVKNEPTGSASSVPGEREVWLKWGSDCKPQPYGWLDGRGIVDELYVENADLNSPQAHVVPLLT